MMIVKMLKLISLSLFLLGCSATGNCKVVQGGTFHMCYLWENKLECLGEIPELDTPLTLQTFTGEYITFASANHGVCAITTTGSLECVGPDIDDYPSGTGYTQVDCGFRSCCATKGDNYWDCWGTNSYGELNFPQDEQYLNLKRDAYATCLQKTDLTWFCVGATNTWNAFDESATNIVEIRDAGYFRAFLNDDGIVSKVGYGTSALPTDGPYVRLDCSHAYQCCAIKADGTPHCFGSTDHGHFEPTYATVLIDEGVKFASKIGFDYLWGLCGVTTDNELKCWQQTTDDLHTHPSVNKGQLEIESLSFDTSDMSGMECSGSPATDEPTHSPTLSPTHSPTLSPTHSPTYSPTHSPTKSPSTSPTKSPSTSPTIAPSKVSIIAVGHMDTLNFMLEAHGTEETVSISADKSCVSSVNQFAVPGLQVLWNNGFPFRQTCSSEITLENNDYVLNIHCQDIEYCRSGIVQDGVCLNASCGNDDTVACNRKNGGSEQCCECFINDSEKYCEMEDDVACIMPETRCTEDHLNCGKFGAVTGTVESGCSCYELDVLSGTHYGLFVTVEGSKSSVTVSTDTESRTIASTRRTLLRINTVGEQMEVVSATSDNYECSISDGPVGEQSHSENVELAVKCIGLQATVVSILREMNDYAENNPVDEVDLNNLRTSIFTMVAKGHSTTICSVWVVGHDFLDNMDSITRVMDLISSVSSEYV